MMISWHQVAVAAATNPKVEGIVAMDAAVCCSSC